MAGGRDRTGSKHSRHHNIPKKRCEGSWKLESERIVKCKKLGRRQINNKWYCKKHCQNNPKIDGEWLVVDVLERTDIKVKNKKEKT